MEPLSASILGGASLAGGMFSSITSAQNAASQLQAQKDMQAQSEQFNAGQASLGREFNAAEAEKARAFNAAQADVARSYETNMSNTAYQRSRADMIKAGLNPILAAGAGGASTPGGSAAGGPAASGPTASIGTPSAPPASKFNPLEGLQKATEMYVNSAVQQKLTDKMTQEIVNMKQANLTEEARTAATWEQRGLIAAQAGTTTKSGELIDAQRAAQLAQLPVFKQAGLEANEIVKLQQSNPEVFKRLVQTSWDMRKADDILAPIRNTAQSFFPFVNKFMRGAQPYGEFRRSTMDREMRPGGQRDSTSSESWWQ